ncbi:MULTISPECIES: acyl carrier protein [Devosia]|uniref:Acyl carrier protein n=1 Tax=Devosia equisanguinis TaxID=2490941 RepID=A0A447IEM4_9HYPH|nr:MULTISPECIES: acyl carrier protein [Devosia]ODT50130.1 MAG: acyl carrier protein [Pelagibacterium sp. SCN 63-126]ODU87404.1 MAG: acyl carrier protein [Pelagibacterium sp. SCN 63-17]OJX44872.1 MAG: acyl carrier protein [Devosia sp. 63-57]VDS05930.1 Acyl carrier protein [Devosia equisanguinis]
MTENIEQNIKNFIVEQFLFGDASVAPANDASLLDDGIMDSTSVLELVAYIEESYGLEIPDADIVPANLDSIAAITRYITARKAA